VPANVSLKTALINEPGVGCLVGNIWYLELGAWNLELGERARDLPTGKLALEASGSLGPKDWAGRGVPNRLLPISRSHIRGLLARLRQTNCGNQSGVVSHSGRTINIKLSRWPKNIRQIAAEPHKQETQPDSSNLKIHKVPKVQFKVFLKLYQLQCANKVKN